ncbi:MAG: PP2C family protein-serine/threonine phosphatase, partial [Spirochaetales bacterium]
KIRSDMSVYLTLGIIFLLVFFSVIVSIIGTQVVIGAFKKEYSTVTYHMADSAAAFVNGDHIDEYLAGREQEEYSKTKKVLDSLSKNLNVSLIYVIQVDQTDYGRYKAVFDSINNEVDHSNYVGWDLGQQRDTTNNEYKDKYHRIYQNESKYETVFRFNTDDGSHPHITTIVPILDSDLYVTALLCVQRPIREFTEATLPFILLIFAGALFLVIPSSILAGNLLRKFVIRPINKVSEEASRFAKEHKIEKPLGEIGRFRTIQNLSKSIDAMESDMVSYVQNLTAVTAEKEKINASLDIAATIQQDALPKVFPAFPDRKEFDIYASMDPAKQIGGDFYNYLLVDEDHLALIIADVSDKGIPAALFMETANTLMCDNIMMGGSPAEIVTRVNERICERNSANMFVTLWLGILEISTGKIVCVNAGHEDPVIYRNGKEFEIVKEKHGLFVGGFEGTKYKAHTNQLHKGDILFLYTDGLPEASNSKNKMFGFERMTETLNKFKNESAQGIVDGVRKAVGAFVGDAPQFDDLTTLCIRYNGPEKSTSQKA